jgi:hypothetical protein
MFRFHLRYTGKLPSNGNTEAKEVVRAHLAPQLAELWNRNPLNTFSATDVADHFSSNRHGTPFRFVVSRDLGLRCDLDILILHGSNQDPAYTTGDVDNRLKTLLDGLRTRNRRELGKAAAPVDPTTGYADVLLEDDSLVESLRVRTEHGLAMPNDRDAVEIVIRVTLAGNQRSWFYVELGV